jgi:dimethylhistidine N-methyltransferase
MIDDIMHIHDLHIDTTNLQDEVHKGLATDSKTLSPKLFYDRRGSELFDAICDLPEYYPTRTEIAILRDNAKHIARAVIDDEIVIELGSGASRKIRLVLDAVQPDTYMGVDISRDFLIQECNKLARDYPELEVHAVCADLCQPLPLDQLVEDRPRLAYFPGSSIGNFEPGEARVLLETLRPQLHDGNLLIAVDLKKDPQVLHDAYNDSQGITAEFNLNLLHRMRNELDADIDIDGFSHEAFYNEDQGRIEMHLVSRHEQQVSIGGQQYTFAAGERIHTENSYKYSIEDFQQLSEQAGFTPRHVWTDPQQLFSIHLLSSAA